MKDAKSNLIDAVGKLFYAGLKTCDAEMTYDVSQNILECLDGSALVELVEVISNSLSLSSDEQKKMIVGLPISTKTTN